MSDEIPPAAKGLEGPPVKPAPKAKPTTKPQPASPAQPPPSAPPARSFSSEAAAEVDRLFGFGG